MSDNSIGRMDARAMAEAFGVEMATAREERELAERGHDWSALDALDRDARDALYRLAEKAEAMGAGDIHDATWEAIGSLVYFCQYCGRRGGH